ncbi:hypothetical protein ACFQ1I_15825 [Kitasatospora arboriphila]
MVEGSAVGCEQQAHQRDRHLGGKCHGECGRQLGPGGSCRDIDQGVQPEQQTGEARGRAGCRAAAVRPQACSEQRCGLGRVEQGPADEMCPGQGHRPGDQRESAGGQQPVVVHAATPARSRTGGQPGPLTRTPVAGVAHQASQNAPITVVNPAGTR